MIVDQAGDSPIYDSSGHYAIYSEIMCNELNKLNLDTTKVMAAMEEVRKGLDMIESAIYKQTKKLAAVKK